MFIHNFPSLSLHKVQNRFESVLYLVEHLDGVFIVLILLVFKKNDSLLYQLAVLYALSLHKVQNRFESVLYLVEHLDGVFIVLILLVFKKNDSLLYQLAVLYG